MLRKSLAQIRAFRLDGFSLLYQLAYQEQQDEQERADISDFVFIHPAVSESPAWNRDCPPGNGDRTRPVTFMMNPLY